MLCAAHAIRCRSNASRADTCRDRAGRNTSRAAACAASSCPPACANPIGCPNRSSRRRRRPRPATTSTSAKTKPATIVGRDWSSRLKALTLEIYRRGCEHAESKGIIIADTKFEFGLVGAGNPARTRPHRRSADARFVALLAAADRTSRATASRASTSSSSATTSKRSVEQAAAGAVAARRGRPRARARSTSKRSACCRAASSRRPCAINSRGSCQEMLDKGVLYDDARREFEKMFIARALQRTKGNVGDAAEMLGLHRNTIARQDRRIPDQTSWDCRRTGSRLDPGLRRAARVLEPQSPARLAVSPLDCLTRLPRFHRISSRPG